MTKKIYLGADHAGFKLKEKLKSWLLRKKIPFEDLGSKTFDPDDDYPDFAEKVAKAVKKNPALGLLICGSAQGMCIAANKIKGIRAVVPSSLKEAELARQHNDANILCLSGWYTSFPAAVKLINSFLNASFSNASRHKRRLNKIKRLEQS